MEPITRQEAREQGLKQFFTGKPCRKHGHISMRQVSSNTCMECYRLKHRNAYQADPERHRQWAREWREANRDAHNLRQREKYAAEPERRQKAQQDGKMRRLLNPEKKRESDRRWRKANWGKLLAQKAAYERERRASDPEYAQKRRDILNQSRTRRWEEDPGFRMSCALRSRLADALKDHGATKSASTMELVGCTREELVAHIEAQFLTGMSWANYGYRTWHIDHRIPCAAFDLTDPEQQRTCFHYTNLQPLWAADNLSKHARLDWAQVEAA